MSKLVSISGVVSKVRDLKKTVEFYEGFGFITTKNESDRFAIRLNWFWMEFIQVDQDYVSAGQFIYICVDNVDDIYKDLQAKGYEFTAEPADYPSGRREAMICDPDGYWLVFFSKKK